MIVGVSQRELADQNFYLDETQRLVRFSSCREKHVKSTKTYIFGQNLLQF